MNAPKLGRRLVSLSLVLLAALTGAWTLGLLSTEASRDAALVEAGREQFTRIRHTEVVADPKLTSHRLFNARSCAECHRQAGIGGGGPNENNVELFDTKTAVWFEPIVSDILGANSGVAVLPRRSFTPLYADWRFRLLRTYDPGHPEVVAQRQVSSTSSGVTSTTGPIAPPLRFFRSGGFVPDLTEERNTPPLFGLGLLESIPQSAIDDGALNQPERIRGRSPRLKGGGFGRFGWKSGRDTLLAFNENACAVELGLTTKNFTPATVRLADIAPDPRLATEGMIGAFGSTTWLEISDRAWAPLSSDNFSTWTPPSPPPRVMRSAGPPPAPDMSDADLAALTRFVASLPAPRQVIEAGRHEQVSEGARHFEAIGCAACHTPHLGGVTGVYSDLLLHKVGTSGGAYYGGTPSDGAPDFDFVQPDEFRTPPLWGVADSAPYMHDGGAPTLDVAIMRHAVQGADAVTAYRSSLNDDQRQSLIAFLESLRAP